MGSIIELKNKLDMLKREEKELFERIFNVFISEGEIEIPHTFRSKVREYFGDRDEHGNIIESEDEVVKRLKNQEVIRILNKWTGEGSLFNCLRSSKPGMKLGKIEEERKKVFAHIEKARINCDFCEAEKYTAEDAFGRVKGKYCITAANIAKYDAYNGVIIFKNHNPLEFSKEMLFNYIETAFKWFGKVHEYKEEFKYPFLMWNCLEKAGASQVHGHMQVLLSTSYYAKVLALRKAYQQYKEEYGRDYFDDLYKVHNSVKLAYSNENVKIFAYLAPIKEKEIIIIGNSVTNYFKEFIFKTLRCYIDKIGAMSFNLSISMPAYDDEFRYIARLVDRGSIFKSPSDIGTMELYGNSVIVTDPYTVITALKEFYSK